MFCNIILPRVIFFIFINFLFSWKDKCYFTIFLKKIFEISIYIFKVLRKENRGNKYEFLEWSSKATLRVFKTIFKRSSKTDTSFWEIFETRIVVLGGFSKPESCLLKNFWRFFELSIIVIWDKDRTGTCKTIYLMTFKSIFL